MRITQKREPGPQNPSELGNKKTSEEEKSRRTEALQPEDAVLRRLGRVEGRKRGVQEQLLEGGLVRQP